MPERFITKYVSTNKQKQRVLENNVLWPNKKFYIYGKITKWKIHLSCLDFLTLLCHYKNICPENWGKCWWVSITIWNFNVKLFIWPNRLKKNKNLKPVNSDKKEKHSAKLKWLKECKWNRSLSKIFFTSKLNMYINR